MLGAYHGEVADDCPTRPLWPASCACQTNFTSTGGRRAPPSLNYGIHLPTRHLITGEYAGLREKLGGAG